MNKCEFKYSSSDEITPLVRTECNGEVLENSDKFEVLLKEMVRHMERATGYSGYPNVPGDYSNISYDLFNNGSDTEKRFMFGYLNSMFGSALQHWKTDKDEMYNQDSNGQNNKVTPFYIC
jgi:hypothetical protein